MRTQHTHIPALAQGLDANQRARVNEVLQSARGQAGDVQDDDDDDCYSVASVPVASSTQRSPSPRLFRRGSGHFVSKPGEVCMHHLHHPSYCVRWCSWITPAFTLFV